MAGFSTREEIFIDLLLSAYEGGSWAVSARSKPDAIDRNRPAVDQIARKADGTMLAIEHTIIEPFVGDKRDFAFFEAEFLKIEQDSSLAVKGRWIQVFVPVGTLENRRKKAERSWMVESVHRWIKANRLSLPDGQHKFPCLVPAVAGRAALEIELTVKTTPLRYGDDSVDGVVHVRRQQVNSDLEQVVETALKAKVPKLVNTQADRRILVLERQHMNLLPENILAEVDKQKREISGLESIDEVWILETMFYYSAFGQQSLRFERYQNGKVVASYDFWQGKLRIRSENGIAEVLNEDRP